MTTIDTSITFDTLDPNSTQQCPLCGLCNETQYVQASNFSAHMSQHWKLEKQYFEGGKNIAPSVACGTNMSTDLPATSKAAMAFAYDKDTAKTTVPANLPANSAGLSAAATEFVPAKTTSVDAAHQNFAKDTNISANVPSNSTVDSSADSPADASNTAIWNAPNLQSAVKVDGKFDASAEGQVAPMGDAPADDTRQCATCHRCGGCTKTSTVTAPADTPMEVCIGGVVSLQTDAERLAEANKQLKNQLKDQMNPAIDVAAYPAAGDVINESAAESATESTAGSPMECGEIPADPRGFTVTNTIQCLDPYSGAPLTSTITVRPGSHHLDSSSQ